MLCALMSGDGSGAAILPADDEGFRKIAASFHDCELRCEPALADPAAAFGFRPHPVDALQRYFRAAATAWLLGSGTSFASFDPGSQIMFMEAVCTWYAAPITRCYGGFHAAVCGTSAGTRLDVELWGYWQLTGRDDDGVLLYTDEATWHAEGERRSRRDPGGATAAPADTARIRIELFTPEDPDSARTAAAISLPRLPIVHIQYGPTPTLAGLKSLQPHSPYTFGLVLRALAAAAERGYPLVTESHLEEIALGDACSGTVELSYRPVPVAPAVAELPIEALIAAAPHPPSVISLASGACVELANGILRPRGSRDVRFEPQTHAAQLLVAALECFGDNYGELELAGYLAFLAAAAQLLDLTPRIRTSLLRAGDTFIYVSIIDGAGMIGLFSDRTTWESWNRALLEHDPSLGTLDGVIYITFDAGDLPTPRELGLPSTPRVRLRFDQQAVRITTPIVELATTMLCIYTQSILNGEDRAFDATIAQRSCRVEPLPIPWAPLVRRSDR
ncbi:MAG: hypothetical protein ABI867_22945 [Kofleriaceae bacterium]